MFNRNEKTGIAYGIVSAKIIDPFIVDILVNDGFNVTDAMFLIELIKLHKFKAHEIEEYKNYFNIDLENINWQEDIRKDWIKARIILDNLNYKHELQQEFNKTTHQQPKIIGKFENVEYETAWDKGVLRFVIISSPFITEDAVKGGPTIPNMGILDPLEGNGYKCYDIPLGWRIIQK